MEENQLQAPKKGMNPMLLVGGLVVLAGIGWFAWPNMNKSSSTTTPPATMQQETTPSETAGKIKTFQVEASSFFFNPKEIKVKKGDKVKIVLNNKAGMHDWVLDEFNARTETIQAGQTAEVEFTADKTGTFEYYCSVGNHRQLGMVGNLIVE